MEIADFGGVVVCFPLHVDCGKFSVPARKRRWWGFAAPNKQNHWQEIADARAHVSYGGHGEGVERLASFVCLLVLQTSS
ncbi:hypothetical protein AB4T72_000133 [Salmonella enterica]